MKLLFINYMSLPIPATKGGAVEYLVEEFLKDNEKTHKHDITLYSIYDKEAQKEALNYKYTKFNFIEIKSIRDKLSRIIRHLLNRLPNIYVGNTYITKVIRAEKNLDNYDAVIIENAPEFALKFPKKYHSKLILHLHNDFLNKNTKKAKKILDCYKNVFTISNTLGNNVQTIYKTEKVKTLYNGINLDKFKYNENMRVQMRNEYNISPSDFVFMYSGRINPDKGVYEMAKAFSLIKGDNLKLIIVGGIGYSKFGENEYSQKIKSINDKRIIFTGFIKYPEVMKLYTIPDVGVIPSIFNDPFNLTTVEFMANGIPIIISNRGAMKELTNDKCSFIAEYNHSFVENIKNALQYMLDNQDKLIDMGTEAKKVSKNFGIEKYIDTFNKLLNDFRSTK